MTHTFFHNFVPREEKFNNITNELAHNLMVFEISNNWPSVKWLICRIKENWIDKIDVVENDWLNFIKTNNIDIETYENSDDFINKHLKSLVKVKNK